MNLTISVAGLNIGIEYTHKYVARQCGKFLTDAQPDFTVTSTPEDWEKERLNAEDENIRNCMLEFTCIHREIAKRLPDYDAFLMHGAAMSADGKGYLFTAPSGTGKTTHIRMWQECFPERVGCINGDKPIVRKIDGQFCFCGSPWRGKERYGSTDVLPIGGICLLERAKENTIQKVTAAEIFPQLSHQVYFQKDQKQLIRFLDLFDEMLSSVPIYRMGCNMDPSAAQMSFAAMVGE